MAASSPYALGILNLFFLLVGIVVLTVVNVYVLVKWQHPEDKNQWVSAKAAVVLGMLVTELVIVGLPLDVANNGGARDCSYEPASPKKMVRLRERGSPVQEEGSKDAGKGTTLATRPSARRSRHAKTTARRPTTYTARRLYASLRRALSARPRSIWRGGASLRLRRLQRTGPTPTTPTR